MKYQFRAYCKKSNRWFSIVNINFSDNVATGVCDGDWEDFDIDDIELVTK